MTLPKQINDFKKLISLLSLLKPIQPITDDIVNPNMEDIIEPFFVAIEFVDH